MNILPDMILLYKKRIHHPYNYNFFTSKTRFKNLINIMILTYVNYIKAPVETFGFPAYK